MYLCVHILQMFNLVVVLTVSPGFQMLVNDDSLGTTQHTKQHLFPVNIAIINQYGCGRLSRVYLRPFAIRSSQSAPIRRKRIFVNDVPSVEGKYGELTHLHILVQNNRYFAVQRRL